MSDEQFWLTIWKLATIAFCVMVASIAGCTASEDYWISQDIAHGANPIAAQCAHSSNGANNAICGSVATRNP